MFEATMHSASNTSLPYLTVSEADCSPTAALGNHSALTIIWNKVHPLLHDLRGDYYAGTQHVSTSIPASLRPLRAISMRMQPL